MFIFLDDAQFSKNSYINRVRIRGGAGPRWLTVAVKVHLGDPINRVLPAQADWPRRHLDSLAQAYRGAPAFHEVWPDLERLYGDLPGGDIAATNRHLVEALCRRLGLDCRFRAASEFETGAAKGDDRLIALVEATAPGGCYLSGSGGAGYQDEAKFARAGLALRYLGFRHPLYEQGGRPFLAGLSIVDALLNLGWAETAALIAPAAHA